MIGNETVNERGFVQEWSRQNSLSFVDFAMSGESTPSFEQALCDRMLA